MTSIALELAKKTANGAVWALTGAELVDIFRDGSKKDTNSELKIVESLEKIQQELNNVKLENNKLEDNNGNTKIAIFIQKVTNNVVFRDDRASHV